MAIDLYLGEIETQLAEALPELAPAATYYWETEGAPGADCGPYIFFELLFARYVQILLALAASPMRDALLQRAFSFVEEMCVASDAGVRDLAFIGFFEGRENWLFARSKRFLGPVTAKVLDERWPGWRSLDDEPIGRPDDLLDGFRVRHVIAHELRAEGVTLEQVPGQTYGHNQKPA